MTTDDYEAQWERSYEEDLLALWNLLGTALRARTTPANFRNWVYEHSVPNGTLPQVADDLPLEWSSSPQLLEEVEENYVQMYHHCEKSYLPLLQDHSDALSALQEICLMYDTSDEDEDDDE